MLITPNESDVLVRERSNMRWEDLPSRVTPINAENLNSIEARISDAMRDRVEVFTRDLEGHVVAGSPEAPVTVDHGLIVDVAHVSGLMNYLAQPSIHFPEFTWLGSTGDPIDAPSGFLIPLRFYAPPGVTVTEDTQIGATTFYGVSKTIGVDYIDVIILMPTTMLGENPVVSSWQVPNVNIAWTDTAYEVYTVRDMDAVIYSILAKLDFIMNGADGGGQQL